MSSFTPPPDGAQGQPYPPQPGQPFPPQPGQFPPQQGQPFPPQPGQPFPPQPAQGMPPQPGQPFPGQPYPQGYAPAPQRNQILWVSSIILIVFAGIILLVGLAGIAVVIAAIAVGSGAAAMAAISLVIVLAGVIFQLYVGIQGVKNAANPHKGDFLFKLGIVLVAIQFISFIFTIANSSGGSNPVTGVFGFLLPVLFTYGAYQLKNQLR